MPKMYTEEINTKFSKAWMNTMRFQKSPLEKLETLNLVDFPRPQNVTQAKLVFDSKRNNNQKFIRPMALLVAKCLSHISEIDFLKLFSLVFIQPTVRIMMALRVK